MSRGDGGPAFPMCRSTELYGTTRTIMRGDEGMSLRDYLAVHAPIPDAAFETFEAEWRYRYQWADAGLRAREEA